MQKNYKKYLLSIILMATTACSLFAQRTKKTAVIAEGVVTYSFRSNGKEMRGAPLHLFFKNNIANLVQGKNQEKKEGQYIDYNQQATYQVLTLKDGSRF
ncbi:MAG: hypothetical protein ABIR03_07910, partial [Ginsengibacter sp.]